MGALPKSIAALIGTATISAVPLLATSTAGAEEPLTPSQVIHTFEDTFDVHPGQRMNHAGAVCARGSFVGTPAASALSRSRLFAGDPLPVLTRFSVIGGNVSSSSAREMALEFRLPDGSLQHMAMLNTPVLVAAVPLAFNEMIKAVKPDPSTGEPDQARLHDFLNSHPDAFAQSNFIAATASAVGYANSSYFSIHTFRFIDAEGRTHFVRWRFIPEDAEKPATPRALQRGPVRWDMIVYVGDPDDTTDNATVAWPENRQHFKAGTLTISKLTPGIADDCEKASFDPLIVADGIAPSDDPVLLFRSPTYASAFVGRLSQALGSPPAVVVGR